MKPLSKRIPLFAVMPLLLASVACSGSGSSDAPPPVFTISGAISGAVSVPVKLTWASGVTSAVTDAAGRYSLRNVPDGTYTITPSKSGFVFSPVSASVTVSGADVTGKDFTAIAGDFSRSISGAISGDTTEGVLVTLGGANSGSKTTLADGAFSFAGLGNGSYTLTPSRIGYTFDPASIQVSVAGSNVTGQDFVATAVDYTISGNVGGASGVIVSLTDTSADSTTTDGSGNYSFTVHVGRYTVTPVKPGYAFEPASRLVAMSGGDAGGQDFTAVVTGTYTLSGTIGGPSPEGVTVTLGGAAAATTQTDASGAYRFTDLANETYTVTPSLDGYGFTPSSALVTMDGNSQTQDFWQAADLAPSAIAGTATAP